jgi:simple sugar transport system permease protein
MDTGLTFIEIVYFLVPLVIASTVPLALVALGALFSERSGVVNIALEGIMLMGAYVGAVVIKSLEDGSMSDQSIALVGLLVGAGIGIVFSLLHAFASINMKANQIISATALNMFAPAFAIFINRTFSESGTQKVTILRTYRISEVPGLSNLPSLGEMFSFLLFNYVTLGLVVLIIGGLIYLIVKKNPLVDKIKEFFLTIYKKPLVIFLIVYVLFSALEYKLQFGFNLELGEMFFQGAYLSTLLGIIIFVIAVIILYKTRIGLRLRSCGENPHAADSLGINIYRIRYLGVMVSGALAGMGGVIFVLSFAANFNATVSGFGFLALAVLIFGNWKPGRIILAALFFAFMRVISSTYSIIPVLDHLNLDSEIYSMLPYLATLVVLAFVSKNSAAPRAAGEPYDPGKR